MSKNLVIVCVFFAGLSQPLPSLCARVYVQDMLASARASQINNN